MKKIEYENGAFEVVGIKKIRVKDHEEGIYLVWDLDKKNALPKIVKKVAGDTFGTCAIFQKIADILKRPKKLRKFEPGLYRVKGGRADCGTWVYRIRKEDGTAVDLNGNWRSENFDTAYEHYEKAEFKLVEED